MKISECSGEIKLISVSDFDLSKILECGQCFRWNKNDDGGYTGVAYGCAAKVRQDGNGIYISGTMDSFNSLWRSYFDFDRDYAYIRQQLCVSDFLCRAAEYGAGIRILHQEPWETLCSFILSQNNNIPRIKKLIYSLCSMFGNPVVFEGETLYSFPDAKTLAGLSESDLLPLRCGYRAGYVLTAARAVASGKITLSALPSLTPAEVRTELKKLPGVGNKVADCVMLYGLHMLDTFPVDVWIKRALSEFFPADFDISALSPYAGIAQQYVFFYARNNKNASSM